MQGLVTFVTADLAGAVYTDPTTGITFTDVQGHNLSVSGGVLSTPNGDDTIKITIPITVVALQLFVNVTEGLCLDADCPAYQTSGFVGFINSSPTGSWIEDISPLQNGGYTQIQSFDAGIISSGGDADAPEVGTLLMIGAGLISMRWIKRIPRRWLHSHTPHLAS
jgi:hypothetical protein